MTNRPISRSKITSLYISWPSRVSQHWRSKKSIDQTFQHGGSSIWYSKLLASIRNPLIKYMGKGFCVYKQSCNILFLPKPRKDALGSNDPCPTCKHKNPPTAFSPEVLCNCSHRSCILLPPCFPHMWSDSTEKPGGTPGRPDAKTQSCKMKMEEGTHTAAVQTMLSPPSWCSPMFLSLLPS